MARSTWSVLLAAVLLGGCLLESPKYEGTAFSCAEPPHACPDGYSCIDSVCRTIADPDPNPAPDGGITVNDTPDAAPNPTPDPDAAPTSLTTTTLSGTNITFDTFLRYHSPNNNYGDAGDVSIDADPLKVGLLRFDLSSIPTTAQVVSAEMILHFSDPIEEGQLVVYRVLEPWSENQATWIVRQTGVPWASPGAGTGSYDPTPLLTTAPRNVGTYTIPIPVATAQSWIAQPQTNYGMKWVSDSLEGRGGEFDSAEEQSPATDAPKVRIQWR